VLARLAVVALAAVLLICTGYLVVQVGMGPKDGAAPAPAVTPAKEPAAPAGAAPAAPMGAEQAARPSLAGSPAAPPPAPPPAAPGEATVAPAATPGSPGSPGEVSAAPPRGGPGDPIPGANLEFDEANKLYDRREYDEARTLALSLLRAHPSSVRMRRIVVASSCIMGDQDTAQQHYLSLPERDRADMRLRCAPYGSAFHE
jgi:hypothetical protein